MQDNKHIIAYYKYNELIEKFIDSGCTDKIIWKQMKKQKIIIETWKIKQGLKK